MHGLVKISDRGKDQRTYDRQDAKLYFPLVGWWGTNDHICSYLSVAHLKISYEMTPHVRSSIIMTLDKRYVQRNNFLISPQKHMLQTFIRSNSVFFCYPMKTYVVGTHLNCPCESLLMRTHNICFHGEIRKIINT